MLEHGAQAGSGRDPDVDDARRRPGVREIFGRLAPDLTHVARRMTIAAGVLDNNAANLHRWINNPPAVKPGALMPPPGLSEQELRYVVAYLQTLY